MKLEELPLAWWTVNQISTLLRACPDVLTIQKSSFRRSAGATRTVKGPICGPIRLQPVIVARVRTARTNMSFFMGGDCPGKHGLAQFQKHA